MNIELDIDLDELVAAHRATNRRARNLRPLFRRMVDDLKEDIDDAFRSKEGPESKWPALAPSTIERKQQRANGRARGRGRSSGRKVSRVSNLGRLRKAFETQTGRDYLLAVSKVDWAHVHQYGGRAGRSEIPQRTHMYVSPRFIRFARNKIADYVARGKK